MNIKVLSVSLLVALAAALGLLGKLGYSNYQLRQAQSQINSELMQAKLEVGRAHTQLGDANSKLGDLSSDLQKEVTALKASVTRYAELEADYKVLQKQKGKTTIEYLPGDPIEVPCPDVTFIRGLLYEAITEHTMAPIRSLAANLKDDRLDVVCMIEPYPNTGRDIPFRVGYSLHFKLKGHLIETRTASGAINHFIELYEVDNNGKEVGKMELTKFDVTVQDETLPHFMWWAPHVDVGILGGYSTRPGFATGGSIGLSAMGYGRTNNDLTWRFVRISLDLSTNAGIGLTPVLYNIGDPLPLVSNIWVGPHLMYGFQQEALLGVFLGGVL
jgi:hypothetical protein